VETAFSVQRHPTTDVLEEYAFHRLPEPDTEALEEHLLMCPECQDSLADMDEYILLVKHVTARHQSRHKSVLQPEFAATRKPTHLGRALDISGMDVIRSLGFALAAALVLICVGIARFSWPVAPVVTAEPVELIALRGGDDALLNPFINPLVNHAHAGRPLDMNVDVTGLPSSDRYRIEIVNSAGQRAWDGQVQGSGNPLAVHIAKGFRRGQYWVRLYSSSQLLREFGLKVDF
jgi:Putative zinc-finger